MRKRFFKKVFVFSVLFSASLNAFAENFAIGPGSTATSSSETAIAIGADNTATTRLSSAVGINNRAVSDSASAFGHLNTAGGRGASAFGYLNTASGEYSSSMGYKNSASFGGSSAFGSYNEASAASSTAVGYSNSSVASNSSAFGYDNGARGASSSAFGSSNVAVGSGALAAGLLNKATGNSSTAIGQSNSAIGSSSFSGGFVNTAGEMSIAIGNNNKAMKYSSSALGSKNMVYGKYSTAVGYNNAIGSVILDGVENTYVLGGNITTSSSNAVVLGHNSSDGGDNTVSVGSSTNLRKIVNVADGAISTTSKDAINGSQLNSVLQNATGINATNWKTALGITDGGNTGGGNDNSATISAVIQYFGGGASVDSTGSLTAPTYTITNISSDTPTANTYNNVGDALTALGNNTKALNTSLLNKANKNADNLSVTDVIEWQKKLGNGLLQSGNNGLVTGGVVADALALKADKTALDALASSISETNTSLNSRADKDLGNLSDVGTTKVKTLAKEAVSVKAGNNVTVSENVDTQTGNKTYTVGVDNDSIKNVAKEAVKPELDAKANKNADNLTDSDVTSWQQKLGNGKVEAGNKGLVTGDTVNEAIVVVNKRIDEVVANPSGVSGQVLEYLGGGATATEAPTYTITDVATGQNVEHNNVGSALEHLNNNITGLRDGYVELKQETQQIRQDMKKLRKEANAGIANAGALALLPQPTMAGRSMVGMSTATFKGEGAIALGISHLSQNNKFILKTGVSINTKGDSLVGAGIGWMY